MTASPFSQFLADSIATAEPGQGLTDDELYGVYTSWCLLRRKLPAPRRPSGPPCAKEESPTRAGSPEESSAQAIGGT